MASSWLNSDYVSQWYTTDTVWTSDNTSMVTDNTTFQYSLTPAVVTVPVENKPRKRKNQTFARMNKFLNDDLGWMAQRIEEMTEKSGIAA